MADELLDQVEDPPQDIRHIALTRPEKYRATDDALRPRSGGGNYASSSPDKTDRLIGPAFSGQYRLGPW